MRQIPAFKYYFPEACVKWITDNIQQLLEKGDYLTLGNYTQQFEKQFAEYTGTKHAVALSSGTAALEAILRAVRLENCEVILPSNTFAATAFAVIHAGATPVFADMGHDFSIAVDDVKKKLSPKTRAIITVHIGGFVSPSVEELRDLAVDHKIMLLEDAAHAQGSILAAKKAGTFGTAAAFSFFSTKVITTGEGGMITTDSEDIAHAVKLIRDQGKVRGNWVAKIGYNWRISELQSIVGIAQLRLIEEIIEKRTEVANVYDKILGEFSPIEVLRRPATSRPNYYKYIILLGQGKDPEKLRAHLRQNFGVSLSGYVYEAPLHTQGVFKKYVENSGEYRVTDDLCSRHVCPPVYPQMGEDDATYVADSLIKSLSRLGWV